MDNPGFWLLLGIIVLVTIVPNIPFLLGRWLDAASETNKQLGIDPTSEQAKEAQSRSWSRGCGCMAIGALSIFLLCGACIGFFWTSVAQLFN